MKKRSEITLVLILCAHLLTAAGTVFELPLQQPITQTAHYLTLRSDADAMGIGHPTTKVAVFADSKAIHVRFRARTTTAPDIPRIPSDFNWEGEHIEIFLAPVQDSPKYYHWAVNLAGQTVSNMGLANASDYHFPWITSMEVSPKGYWINVTIPLDSIGLTKGLERGQALDMNLCRVADSPVGHYQSLVAINSNFHQRNRFPTWVVGSFREGAELALREKITQPDSQLQEAAKLVTDSTTFCDFMKFLESRGRKVSLESLKHKGLVFWQTLPCIPPKSSFLPSSNDLKSAFKAQALHGERITLAIAMGNVSDTPIRFRVQPDTFMTSGANQVRTEKACLIQRLVETRLRSGDLQRDALVELDIHDIADCRTGENEIFYLTVDTAQLTPGHWSMAVTIEPTLETSLRKEIPIHLDIKQTKLPQEGLPYSLNFPWYHYMKVSGHGQSHEYQEAVLINQQHYGTNFHLIGPREADTLAIQADADGKPVWKLNMRELDRHIKVFGVAKQRFLIATGYRTLGCEPGKFNPHELDDAFKLAMQDFRRELNKRKLKEKQIAWYVTDEPSPTTAKLALPAATLIRKHAPKQRTFCTFYPEMGLEPLTILKPAINLWCPAFHATTQQLKAIGGKPEIFYAVSNRTFHPYNSYRLYLWKALERGASGAAFWSYDDVGHGPNASMWNDSDGNRTDCAVIYEGSRAPQGSVRQLAWFRGIQDWRILELAKQQPHLKDEVAGTIRQVINAQQPIADQVIGHLRERFN